MLEGDGVGLPLGDTDGVWALEVAEGVGATDDVPLRVDEPAAEPVMAGVEDGEPRLADGLLLEEAAPVPVAAVAAVAVRSGDGVELVESLPEPLAAALKVELFAIVNVGVIVGVIVVVAFVGMPDEAVRDGLAVAGLAVAAVPLLDGEPDSDAAVAAAAVDDGLPLLELLLVPMPDAVVPVVSVVLALDVPLAVPGAVPLVAVGEDLLLLAITERVLDGVTVAVEDGVSDPVLERVELLVDVPVEERLSVALELSVAVILELSVGETVAVRLDVRVPLCEADTVGGPLLLPLGVPVRDAVAVMLCEGDGVPLLLPLVEPVEVTLELTVPVVVALELIVAVVVMFELAVAVIVSLELRVAVVLNVRVPLGDTVALRLGDTVAL